MDAVVDDVGKKEDSLLSEESNLHTTKEILVLTTSIGTIQIVLRPDLSSESVSYLRQMATTPNACTRCNLYRAEKPGILQGIIASPTISIDTIVKGKCPPGYENVSNECPPWDTECNCHGPIMTKGMVGWAAGATGPDFFIDTYERPAKWWGTQHTVFGEIQDMESFHVIMTIYNTVPTHETGGLTHLNEPLHFTISLTHQ
jgi:cyclophilin family peptidyl-prolyl cis-trans isomerase